MIYLAAVCTLATAIFCDKAVHIDDTLFLYAARHILSDPLHPFAFFVNWDNRPELAHGMFANPPGYCYLLALLLKWGASPLAIHLLLAPMFGLLVLATARLARFMRVDATVPCLLVAVSPVAMVCATNIMPDMFAAAMATLGAAIWLQADRDPPAGGSGARRSHLLAGGALLCLGAFSRYNAGAAWVGVCVYALARRRTTLMGWLALGLTPALLFAWVLGQHGSGAVAKLSSWRFDDLRRMHLMAIGSQLALGSAIPLYAVLGWQRRDRWKLAVGALGALVLFVATRPGSRLGLAAVFAAVGFALIAGVIAALLVPTADDERAEAAGLACWVLTALAVPVVYVHMSSKYLVILLPPLAVLAARSGLLRRTWLWSTVMIGAVLSVGAAAADFQFANALRQIASDEVAPRIRPTRTVWVKGHWGFQYYAEALGARHLDVQALPEPGDLVVALTQTTDGVTFFPAAEADYQTVDERRIAGAFPMRTMNYQAHAGFYADAWGLLPFWFGQAPLETVSVYMRR